MNRYKKSGWWGESTRHSMARRGIRTKQDLTRFGFRLKQYNPRFQTENLKQTTLDYYKIDYSLVSNLKSFLHNKFSKAVPEHLENDANVIEAKKDIDKINHPSKLRAWVIKHKNTLELLGLGSAFIVLGNIAGVSTLMQNTATGEIVAVGGTLLGRAGQIAGTVFTGMSVFEEAKVIQKDVYPEISVRPEDINIEQNKPKAFIIKVSDKKIDSSYSKIVNNPNESLAEISSQPIPYNKLTELERKNLFNAVRKVRKMLSTKGKKINFNESNLQIVKRVGKDDTAYGAHQDKLIQIDRDILLDKEKLDGVLAHESLHKVYDVRDETRDLENLHIDYLGVALRND